MSEQAKPQTIVVLDRGFVYVGEVAITADQIVITKARNVRRWGTIGGLGQLALKGPTENTKLDQVGTVIASARSVNHMIPCLGNW